VHEGKAATVVGLAYTNSFAGAPTTQLYGIDTQRDKLVLVDPPNDGMLATLGSLKVNVAQIGTSFDISARDGRAYMLATPRDGKRPGLYRINLATGAARIVGALKGAPALNASRRSRRRARSQRTGPRPAGRTPRRATVTENSASPGHG